MSRLRYYYAIIECDSAATGKFLKFYHFMLFLFSLHVNLASAIYNQCDGNEYERSSNVIDLRFVPDDVVFEDEPKDVANSVPDLEKFEPME